MWQCFREFCSSLLTVLVNPSTGLMVEHFPVTLSVLCMIQCGSNKLQCKRGRKNALRCCGENCSGWGEDRVQGFNYIFFKILIIFLISVGKTSIAGLWVLHVLFLIFFPSMSYSINLFYYRENQNWFFEIKQWHACLFFTYLYPNDLWKWHIIKALNCKMVVYHFPHYCFFGKVK